MTKKEIIEKIKKCLALSASSNEHEAEIALRQARALMEKYGIEDAEMLASEAGESFAKSGAKTKPSHWESALCTRIARSFGCTHFFSEGYDAGRWIFVGCSPAPEIASYAFSVLQRQCKRARANHIKTALKRCTPANTVRRADLFCEGWVYSVAHKIDALVPGEKKQLAIQAYLGLHYPSLTTFKPTNRNAGRSLREYDHRDFNRGFNAGKDAELNRGVGGDQQLALEG
jgi:hypothetical protein